MRGGLASISGRSGAVISTCHSGFKKKHLRSRKSLDEIHGTLAQWALPTGPVGGKCVACWLWLVKEKTTKWEQVFACAIRHPAEIANAWEASG